MDVAVIGGTGAEGFGLALRLARAGHRAIIGSRDAGRGADSAAKAADLAGGTVEGTDNAGAAARDETTNLLVPMREALRVRCTVGEISNVLREEFGTYDAQLPA